MSTAGPLFSQHRRNGVDNVLERIPTGGDGHVVIRVAPRRVDRPLGTMFAVRTALTLSLLIVSSGGLDAGPMPPVAKGATYYLSPVGNDSNPGTTPDRP